MRITGFVEVSNRLLPAFNMRSKNKGAQCQLSIGRKPGDGVLAENEVLLMISNKQDRNGAKYKVLFFNILDEVIDSYMPCRSCSPPINVRQLFELLYFAFFVESICLIIKG